MKGHTIQINMEEETFVICSVNRNEASEAAAERARQRVEGDEVQEILRGEWRKPSAFQAIMWASAFILECNVDPLEGLSFLNRTL